VVGSYVYVAADEDDLHVIDISNPQAPRELPAYDVPGDANGVAVNGQYAYVAAGGAGLQVVDLSNGQPAASEWTVGEWTTGYGRDVYRAGDYVYLTTEQRGVQVISVATPTAPVKVGEFDTLGTVTHIDGFGDYIYVTGGSGGLLVFKAIPAP
jgi:hypothetical protein